MLTATTSAPFRAVWISLSWPAWRAPIVGTSPIVLSDFLAGPSASRISLAVWRPFIHWLRRLLRLRAIALALRVGLALMCDAHPLYMPARLTESARKAARNASRRGEDYRKARACRG